MFGPKGIEELEKAVSRDRDPVVPRGAVVARSERGVEAEAGGGEGRERGARGRTGREEGELGLDAGRRWFKEERDGRPRHELFWGAVARWVSGTREEKSREAELIWDMIATAYKDGADTAQERIRALEARLEEVRGVVRAAQEYILSMSEESSRPHDEVVDDLNASLDALSPATREWAEGRERRRDR